MAWSLAAWSSPIALGGGGESSASAGSKSQRHDRIDDHIRRYRRDAVSSGSSHGSALASSSSKPAHPSVVPMMANPATAAAQAGRVVVAVACCQPGVLAVEIGVVADQHPHAGEAAADAVGLGGRGVVGPVEGGEHVGQHRVGRADVEVVLAPVERFAPVDEPGGVTVTGRGQLTRFAEAVEGELADGFQQPVVAGGVVEQDEALVDEAADDVEHVVAGDVDIVGGHGFGGLQREGAPEHGQAAQDGPLWSSRRSTLHAIEASRVCWRGRAVRAPPVRRRKASSRPPASRSRGTVRVRAAASSRARGIPSRRTQMATTWAAVSSSMTRLGRTRRARSKNRRAAS